MNKKITLTIMTGLLFSNVAILPPVINSYIVKKTPNKFNSVFDNSNYSDPNIEGKFLNLPAIKQTKPEHSISASILSMLEYFNLNSKKVKLTQELILKAVDKNEQKKSYDKGWFSSASKNIIDLLSTLPSDGEKLSYNFEEITAPVFSFESNYRKFEQYVLNSLNNLTPVLVNSQFLDKYPFLENQKFLTYVITGIKINKTDSSKTVYSIMNPDGYDNLLEVSSQTFKISASMEPMGLIGAPSKALNFSKSSDFDVEINNLSRTNPPIIREIKIDLTEEFLIFNQLQWKKFSILSFPLIGISFDWFGYKHSNVEDVKIKVANLNEISNKNSDLYQFGEESFKSKLSILNLKHSYRYRLYYGNSGHFILNLQFISNWTILNSQIQPSNINLSFASTLTLNQY